MPLTLQRLSGKEEQQRQAPQNLESHAEKITRGKPAQTRGCHHRREALFHHRHRPLAPAPRTGLGTPYAEQGTR